jgi:nitrate/nitrite-specific signal transduction histidine kinase
MADTEFTLAAGDSVIFPPGVGGGLRNDGSEDEAVANVARHASAHTCQVHLEANDWLTLTVEDDGIGIGPDRGVGVGLLSMRERAEELGGHFAIERRKDGPGTRLTVRLPLSRPLAG